MMSAVCIFMSLSVLGVRICRASTPDASAYTNIHELTARAAEIQEEIGRTTKCADTCVAEWQQSLELCHTQILNANRVATEIQQNIDNVRQTVSTRVAMLQQDLELCHTQILNARQFEMDQQNSDTTPDASARRSKEGASTRHPFSPAEDALLLFLVEKHGCNQWCIVAPLMNRTLRQCRERWQNYLSPTVRIAPWTHREEQLLLTLVGEIGKHWAEIGRQLTRSEADVKNHYYYHLKPDYSRQMKSKSGRVVSDMQQLSPLSASFPVLVHDVTSTLQVAPPLPAAQGDISTIETDANSDDGRTVEFDPFGLTGFPDKETLSSYDDLSVVGVYYGELEE
ncbi:MAG: hypothetical protein LBR89_02745 [Holosporales bacterium]|jgi:hypothetical protein|nr:hypothetical protein [Holosporales bacterium]